MKFSQLRVLFVIILSFQLMAVGCVRLTPAAKGIYIVSNTQEVSACTRIGSVSAKSMQCVDPASCILAAEAQARNQAAAMGATHLLKTYGGINVTHGLFDGYAYNCTNNQVGVQKMELNTFTPPVAGCTKDIECKGDRVCHEGKCVSPLNAPKPQ